jgi:cytochrome c peroxidase
MQIRSQTGAWWSAGLLIVVSLAACTTGHRLAREPARPAIPLGLDLYLPVPDDNPMTPASVALGRRLFFDPILSRDRSLACASCHKPQRAFTDGRITSTGVFARRGPRNVPALINRAYGKSHFWDGRTTSLEQQVLQPIQAAHEMGMTVEEAVKRLRQKRSYHQAFEAAFGQAVDAGNLARALASYVRTILSGTAPIDRYMNGEQEALSEQARQGLRLFRGRANCTACHLGPTFSDEQFHNTGIAWRNGVWLDVGRFAITGEEYDRGAFKTPTLREVVRTAPYMHDGSLATLEAVIAFYDRGGNANPYLDEELRPLHLTEEEKATLLAFLRALSGDISEGL